MCGIVGFIDYRKLHNKYEEVIYKMNGTLNHRGPDASGIWVDQNKGIALGHRRLSIIDVSESGNQPMISASKRYVMVFNGEIYNYKDIKKDLIDYRFLGTSDSEVIVAAFEKWGIEKSVKKLVGMFAIAVYDQHENQLYLIRDRVGEKPLYYGRYNNCFMFASELKGIYVHPFFKDDINRRALALYMRHNYVPAPYTIYQNSFKLQPGCILRIDCKSGEEESITYWSAKEIYTNGIIHPYQGTFTEATDHLHELLRGTIKQQMLASDVPVGAFLSGGIDSSTIVAIMQSQSEKPIKTFTIGFTEKEYNEAKYAKAVAKRLGTEHSEYYLTPKETLDVVPLLGDMFDEPFADSSQIPTYLVSKITKQQVAVSLSGDAGDELFSGYSRYFMTSKLWKRLNYLPVRLRVTVFSLILKLIGEMNIFSLRKSRNMVKLSQLLSISTLEEFYREMVSHWTNSDQLVLMKEGYYQNEAKYHLKQMPFLDSNISLSTDDNMLKMAFLDFISYLPDDILVKVDRTSMAVSLESRIPFLDHRIVEFAASLPMSFKADNKTGKKILKNVLRQYIPNEMIERPKMGFGVPIDYWLRNELKDWANDLLNYSRMKQEGYFNVDLVHQKWREHVAGTHDWHYYIWDVLMFQQWHQNQKK